MVVTMDIGTLTDIHPKNKQEVGRRLALCALADAGRKVVSSGPIYRKCEFKDGKARLKFDHVGGGFDSRDDKPLGGEFEIAGADKVFHPVDALTTDGDAILVSSEEVPDPKAVRYAFKSNAIPHLMNKEGLPASPFRTDRW
jgi:sialate O-acetylesterase